MRVNLIEHTPNPDQVSVRCALTCHNEEIPYGEITEQKKREVLRETIKSGHVGVLEHTTFTFGVEGVTRSLTHQLVRHRIATYDQQSMRVVEMDRDNFTVPKSVEKADFDKKMLDKVRRVHNLYDKMIENGVPKEDARMILPIGTNTNITVTMNSRVLRHFFRLRCCKRAQWEIRELAFRMLSKCKEIAPLTFETAGTGCMNEGCSESDTFSCGNPYDEKEVSSILEKIRDEKERDQLFFDGLKNND